MPSPNSMCETSSALVLSLLPSSMPAIFFSASAMPLVWRVNCTADASAVQFTRQTRGIAGALKKIAGIDEGSKLKTNAEEVSHMLFGDGMRSEERRVGKEGRSRWSPYH